MSNFAALVAFISLFTATAFFFYEIVIADRFGFMKDPFTSPLFIS